MEYLLNEDELLNINSPRTNESWAKMAPDLWLGNSKQLHVNQKNNSLSEVFKLIGIPPIENLFVLYPRFQPVGWDHPHYEVGLSAPVEPFWELPQSCI